MAIDVLKALRDLSANCRADAFACDIQSADALRSPRTDDRQQAALYRWFASALDTIIAQAGAGKEPK